MAELAPSVIAAASGLLGTGVGGLITFLMARQHADAALVVQQSEWAREDRQRRLSDYADLVAAATDIMAAWSDLLVPRPNEEIQEMEKERQGLYERLQRLIAMVRISAPDNILDAAEAMMVAIRRAQGFARDYALLGKGGVEGGPQNTAWQEIERSFTEARSLFALRVRATLPELPPWDASRAEGESA